MKKLLPLLILLIVFSGCVHKVYVDGLPMPHSSYNEINIQTKIRIEAYAAKMTEKSNSNGDSYLEPKFLDIGKDYRVDIDNIDHVLYHFKVTNPKRHTYGIRVKYHYMKNGSSKTIEKQGQQGNFAKEEFSIKIRDFLKSDKIKKVSVFLLVDKYENDKKEEIFNIKLGTLKEVIDKKKEPVN